MKIFKLSLFCVLFFVFLSCSSLKKFEAGEQGEAYVTDFEEKQVVVNTQEHGDVNEDINEFLNDIGKDGSSVDDLIVSTKELYDELQFYKEYMFSTFDDVNYEDSMNTKFNGSPDELIYNNKQKSRVTVNSDSQFANSITIYKYVEGKIYDVFFTPANVTDIKLETGEGVINIILGNPRAWICDQVIVSEGENECTHIFIRPLSVNMQSDCVIATTKRIYYLRLISSVSTAQMSVRWYYPYSGNYSGNNLVKETILHSDTSEEFPYSNATGFSKTVADLNFNYKIEGNASWKPVRAYSDRERTYIQFKNEFLTNSETPTILLKQGNEESLVNYSINGITYIVPLILSSNEKFVLMVEDNIVTVSQDN